jgi:hypothetical protein
MVQMDDPRKDWNSYPVKTVAVEVGWVLNTPEGNDFLTQLNKSENLDLFYTETIEILTLYLFEKYKKKVLTMRVPLYVLTLFFFLANIWFHE